VTQPPIGPGDFLPVIPSPIPAGGRTNVLALAHLHMKAGWHPAPVHSFTVPLWYGGTYDEQEAARERAVIFDRSHLGRFYVTGDRTSEVLARVFATDTRQIPPGSIRRLVACRDDGAILDIATGCHIEAGRWLIVTGPRAQVRLREAVEAAVRPEDDVVVRDRLTESVLLSVQGPESAALLETVVGQTIPGAVPAGEAHEILLGGYRALVAHHSETGEDGYWFLMSGEVAEHFWENSILGGITPAGLAALDTLRIEAGLIEAPTETPAPATPYHAGLGDLVDLDGTEGARDFPGAAVLRAVAALGRPERELVGLRLDGPRLAKRGSRIKANGQDVGAAVNAVYSPVLQTGIAVAYLPPTLAPGLARVEIDTDGVGQPADVVDLPFIVGPRELYGR
jgi:aminomethyltransferase